METDESTAIEVAEASESICQFPITQVADEIVTGSYNFVDTLLSTINEGS